MEYSEVVPIPPNNGKNRRLRAPIIKLVEAVVWQHMAELKMQITKINWSFSQQLGCGQGDVAKALLATFHPFGSLTEGVNTLALATALANWVSAQEKQKELITELLALAWSAETDQTSTLEVGVWGATLRTPTSGTAITIRRTAGRWTVEVDFGPGGSESRAVEILKEAVRQGARNFHAFNGEDEIAWETVLQNLRASAEEYLSWLEGGSSSYADDYRAELISSARGDIEKIDVVAMT